MLKDISKRDNLLFIAVLVLAVCLVGLILLGNIYDSLYPPLYVGPVIDVEQVLKRIKQADLIPSEARYYRVIEKDRRGSVKELDQQ